MVLRDLRKGVGGRSQPHSKAIELTQSLPHEGHFQWRQKPCHLSPCLGHSADNNFPSFPSVFSGTATQLRVGGQAGLSAALHRLSDFSLGKLAWGPASWASRLFVYCVCERSLHSCGPSSSSAKGRAGQTRRGLQRSQGPRSVRKHEDTPWREGSFHVAT